MNKLLIISAIIWAALILLASYLFNDVENYKYMFGALVTAAGFQNALIYSIMKKKS